MPPLRCVCIDGGIGCGKSTAIRRISACPHVVEAVLGAGRHVVPVLEPIEQWQDTGVFSLMCKHPERWAHPFQHVAMVTRISQWAQRHEEHVNDPNALLLLERAPHADKLVFTHVLTERGSMTRAQQLEHHTWWTAMWELRPSEIERVGIMSIPFDTAKKRIQARNRDGEDDYPWAYVQQLHDRYAYLATCNTARWPLHAHTAALDASTAFHTCDRALYHLFASLCGGHAETNGQQIACSCGRCRD